MNHTGQHRTPELWGGLECTMVRIRDTWRDQFVDTGHASRLGDLERVAALGIRTLRYPILWESVSPHSPDEVQWSWHDERISKLRALGIDPIAGLLHHGSGPRYTDLLDESLPERLAVHAGRVARRYPWINQFTPVNEPLTTARFSALYGHWYPHKADQRSFSRALINQCRAVALSMRAIREVNPAATLVQTDDLGKTFSTSKLRYQAEYENDRRWLTFDLLFGRVDRSHPWFEVFLREGISERELFSFLEHPCPPDIVGINHYLTSERYLTEDRDEFPRHHWGFNGRDHYADVEAVRISSLVGNVGPYARLDEAWQRYGTPLAVTEVQHGCSRDEQLRWLMEVWQAAQELGKSGADIRGVTLWALFGAADWNTLLREHNGFYEPGAFDVRTSPPRPTAVARAATALTAHGGFDHPVLDVPGWWLRDNRFYQSSKSRYRRQGAARPLIVIGAHDERGRQLCRIAEHRGLEYHRLTEADYDLSDANTVRKAIIQHSGWAVIDARGLGRSAFHSQKSCHARQVGAVAEGCANASVPLLAFSSHLVFDGMAGRPYVESDAPCPDGHQGTVAAEMEQRIQEAHVGALVVRAGQVFSPSDVRNFALSALQFLTKEPATFDDTNMMSPSYLPDLVHAAFDLLIDGESGIWNLANREPFSEFRMAQILAECAGLPQPAPKWNDAPCAAVLASEKAQIMPSLESALRRFIADMDHGRQQRTAASSSRRTPSVRPHELADALGIGP